MNRIEPLGLDELGELEDLFRPWLERAGFVPASLRTMARRPKLARAWVGVMRAVFDPDGLTPLPLRNLVALVASQAAGCVYCMAHTGAAARRSGVADQRIAAVWEFEESPLFDAAERAALRLALAAAQSPSAVDDALMAEVRSHYPDDAIVELMGVIAAFGFLNRWNDGLATGLEAEPLAFAEAVLGPKGWRAGKHAAE